MCHSLNYLHARRGKGVYYLTNKSDHQWHRILSQITPYLYDYTTQNKNKASHTRYMTYYYSWIWTSICIFIFKIRRGIYQRKMRDIQIYHLHDARGSLGWRQNRRWDTRERSDCIFHQITFLLWPKNSALYPSPIIDGFTLITIITNRITLWRK